MLSYRHAFHAGNHADVLKHLVLVQALDYLLLKDKPFWFVDTHAGAGSYELGKGVARGIGEYQEGIGRLWDAPGLPPALARYVALVRRANPDGTLRYYPGSPRIAQMMLRPCDRIWLHELHPADLAALQHDVTRSAIPARVLEGDGFAGLRALLPPQPRRGLAIIDPSYELDTDYAQVVEALQDAIARFAGGVYLLWYPLLAQPAARRLVTRLAALQPPKWLDVKLELRAPDGPGLYGSGMYVVNPPWTLAAALDDCRDALLSRVAPGGRLTITTSPQA